MSLIRVSNICNHAFTRSDVYNFRVKFLASVRLQTKNEGFIPSPPLKLVHTLQVVRALYCVKKQFDNGQKVWGGFC